ncbi:MAG: hypothetical protein R6U19_02060 [Bacteroidales bacterium]
MQSRKSTDLRIESIIEVFQFDERVKALAGDLKITQEACYHLPGLAGSSPAFLAAAVFQKLSCIHLFVLPEREAAAYFFNDLENIFNDREKPYHKKQVLFFPASYKRPYELKKTDSTNLLSRAEVLKRISSRGKKTLLVTYPQALAENVVSRNYIKKHTFRLQQGEQVSIDFINDLLHEYGFSQTDFVLEPGQFAVRGGIIDVFSFTNDNPYRIEFFGDEVESIRSFNPEDQLSLDRLNHISIVPNVQDRENDAKRQAFLEYLPLDTVLWIENLSITLDRIAQERKNAESTFGQANPAGENAQDPERLFTDPDSFRDQLELFNRIEFGNQNELKAAETIYFNHSPQASFNKTFSLLLDTLEKNREAGYKNFIFTDNPRQIERLHNIIEDLQQQRRRRRPEARRGGCP